MPQRQEDSKNHKERYKPLPAELDDISRLIVDAAYVVHYALGPGLL